ncbi:hypothetical protein PV08_07906 [Exophiala spinifera]|uniref:Cupin type-2 domain-containing protein n=1 Tax=Exophiala spinifera TaxID=91928 RepID=A0A0D2BV52_9EURO|nr:uncharacterized protein PV08_07906 [Exophiala spinifera]KIW15119.1 hypothetical protein PV08_07906 [Exophiala spinifera]
MSLPDPRRIVTGHNDVGKAVFLADSRIALQRTPLSASLGVVWESTQFPVDNSEDGNFDPTKTRTSDLVNKDGVIMRVVDIDPRITSNEMLFHRTESMDFGILMHGEVSCYLDDGVKVDMKPGDICVQRGTIHGWTNSGSTAARLYFVLIAAKPVEIRGQKMEMYGYHSADVASGGIKR